MGHSRTKDSRVIAVLIGWLLIGPGLSAQQGAVFKGLLERVRQGEHTEGVQSTTKAATAAACSLNDALLAMLSGDATSFETRIDLTIASVDGAIRTIERELATLPYSRLLNLQQWRNVTDLDLGGVTTQRDLLNRILGLIKEQREALGRLKSGGTEQDLARAIGLGGQISRMLTVYLTA